MSEKETRPDTETGPDQTWSEVKGSEAQPTQPAASASEADWFRDLATMSFHAPRTDGDEPEKGPSPVEEVSVAPEDGPDTSTPSRPAIRKRLSALFGRRRTEPPAPTGVETFSTDTPSHEDHPQSKTQLAESGGDGDMSDPDREPEAPADEPVPRKRGVPTLRLFRAKASRPIEAEGDQAAGEPDLPEASALGEGADPVTPGPDARPPLVQRLKTGLDRGDLVTRGLRGARAQKKRREPGGTGTDKARGYPPIQVILGWIEESSRKDVLEHARGFAADHIETLETAWIAMAEFRGGTLFEIHEGGGGYAYLPELIEGMSRDPDQILWVPSGMKMNRVVTLSIVEGRPFSMMLNEADSARVRASGQLPVERTGRMKRLQPRGTPVLVLGATLFGLSFAALSASAYLAIGIDQQPIPSLSYNPENLPHAQIVTLSDALREDRWVSRIQFENGTWRAEFETFDELILPEDTEAAQRIIDEAVERDGVLQEERERKIREMQAR
ncbi:hypothetical protein IQ03_01203 [Gemmobacter caeni]|uniref:Uncharacterized protein n=1 Tax=Gemmobacter caeni TaxID=589035 RepID=A0A2T6B906_9RHOB|nr:hypothetical protein [Gemmobacter caeni]PTX52544.1 hypothetical protein C8N34_102324 [Gemmobacter caeni]TWJ02785.1 hypothetical protein IQ03_01203 [Gemmobacter caeni]